MLQTTTPTTYRNGTVLHGRALHGRALMHLKYIATIQNII